MSFLSLNPISNSSNPNSNLSYNVLSNSNPTYNPNSNASLTDTVNKKIAEQQKNIDKNEQVQSLIHKEVNYLYNSINLLVGRRACGKSFNVIREFIKIDMLPHHGGVINLTTRRSMSFFL
jgi:hypothetical protein